MTISGWGLGEWTDMAWGTGLDYVYDPTVFFDAEGPYITSRSASGSLVALTATGTRASFTSVGPYPVGNAATGRMPVFAASGSLVVYTATGVIEN